LALYKTHLATSEDIWSLSIKSIEKESPVVIGEALELYRAKQVSVPQPGK
jgi:pyruvate/2-oxoglutarate/acetoin dehydrogenase E1 component